MKMNQEIKEKWVLALRSGEYKQAKHELCVVSSTGAPIGHCCLGVLSDICAKERPDLVKWEGNKLYYNSDGEGIYETQILCDPVMQWAEINKDDQNGWLNPNNPSVIDGDGNSIALAILNDGGYSFEQIATFIEKSL